MKNLLLLLLLVTCEVFAGIPLSSNFTVNTALPIEDRMSVATITARNAIPTLRRWEGMLVYVVADKKHYALINGLTDASWTELSGGGGNLVSWLTATAYKTGNTVIQSNKIYIANSDHTSGTFATDLAANLWTELSAQQDLTTKSQEEATAVVTTRIDTPHKQLTTTATGVRLLETGNANMLANASFEGLATSGVANGWVSALGTPTLTTTATEWYDGKQAQKISLTAQSLSFNQILSGMGAYNGRPGVVGIAYRVPSNITDFQVCARVDAVNQACTTSSQIINDDTFRVVEVPFTFGASTAGILVRTISGATANIYLDAAYMRQGSQGYQTEKGAFLPPPMTDVQMKAIASPRAGMTVFNTDYGILASYNGTTWNYHFSKLQGEKDFYTQIPVNGIPVTTLQGEAFINGNCNWNSSTANAWTCNFIPGKFTSPPHCMATPTYLPGNSGNTTVTNVTTGGIIVNTIQAGNNVQLAFNLKCTKAGADYAATAASAVLQSNANTNETDYTATFGPGWGTVSPSTNQCKYSLVGGNLVGSCAVTMGSPANALYSISLPSGFTIDTTKIGVNNSTAAAGKSVGKWVQTSCRGEIITATATSTSAIYLGSCGATSGGYLVPQVANASFNAQLTSIDFSVPVVGRTNSPFMIGSFEGLEKCANAYECTDTFSAYVDSVGAVSYENIDWINGSCTNANPRVCTFNTFLRDGVSPLAAPMICNVSTTNNSQNYITAIPSWSNTSISVMTVDGNNSSTATKQGFSITCQKTGSDSRPKTAKAAIPFTQVFASYWISSSVTSSTTQPINFDSKEWDSHNAVTTSSTAWKFTAPISGTYRISFFANPGGQPAPYKIYKNGSLYKSVAYGSSGVAGSATTTIKLNANEYFDIRTSTSITNNGGAIGADLVGNISIERAGEY